MKVHDKNDIARPILAAWFSGQWFFLFVIFLSVCFSMFLPWEMGGESWGYWFFAKELLEEGGFLTSGRNPLYTVYLLPFLALPYPYSVDVEYLVSTTLVCVALYTFLRTQIRRGVALFATIALIPFLQQNEPLTQKIALALICIAMLLRMGRNTRRQKAISYALFMAAAMMRQNFIFFPAFIAIFDLWLLVASGGVRAMKSLRPTRHDWPLLVVVLLTVLFATFPSNHPRNNAWLATDTWLPKGDSLGTVSIIGHYNWRYIWARYGTYEGKDIYFTHQEAYNGAKSVEGMIKANPPLFFETLFTNVREFVPTATWCVAKLKEDRINWVAMYFLFILGVYGAWRQASRPDVKIFVTVAVISAGITVISFPKARYMFPLVPVYAMAAAWYGNILYRVICRVPVVRRTSGISCWLSHGTIFLLMLVASFRMVVADMWSAAFLGTIVLAGWLALLARNNTASRFLMAIAPLPVMLVVFAEPLNSWIQAIVSELRGVNGRALAILENGSRTSMKAAFPVLRTELEGCKGVLALEHNFLAAFVLPTRTQVIDVFEIPPFGTLETSAYHGLNPERVDCIYESRSLVETIGMGTNVRLRYDGYIRPYIERLRTCGAREMPVASGRIIRLPVGSSCQLSSGSGRADKVSG